MGPRWTRPDTALQRAIGDLLRHKVAGPDADARGRQIWGRLGPRWFTPDDPIWQVHQDAAMFPGGVAALLVQMLHPRAMAGVAGHSGYKSDPWGRLQRTSDYLAVTTYGTIDSAEATLARVREIHQRVRGKDHRGRPYRASEPELLRWVQLAETWSFLTAHQRYARHPLSAEAADRYVQQTGFVGSQLGATDLPQSVAELESQLDACRGDLEVSPAALEAARFLLHEPPLPRLVRPGYWLIASGGVALLKPWMREPLGLATPSPISRAIAAAGRVGVRAVGWALAADAPDRGLGHRSTAPA